MPTWDFSAYHADVGSPKPALAHSLSRRRVLQLRLARQELADADTPPFQSSDTPFPRKSASDEDLRDKVRDAHSGLPPQASAQRTVRRKKSSFDLRDLFLNGGVLPSPVRTPPDASS